MRQAGPDRDFVCLIAGRPARPALDIRERNSPDWAEAAGVCWHAPEGMVTAAREDSGLRLVLRDYAGDAKAVEWVPSAQRVTLRRSELWSKPLYFFVGNGELLVSDSLRQVVRSLPFRPTLDPRALDAYLALEFFPAPLTPFREIRKVGVEEVCSVDLPSGTARYITGALPERVPRDFEAALEDVRGALARAVDDWVREGLDEPVLFCSGGLDSTILAHMMRGRGRAIVLSYAGSWKDELLRARGTAERAGLPIQETRLPDFRAEQLRSYAALLDEPLGGTCGFAVSHLCALSPSSRVLAGHGSGVLSLMNVKHKHLRDALASGPPEGLVARFSQRVEYMHVDSRRRLLGSSGDPRSTDPVEEMLDRERPSHADDRGAILAIIRRQLCVAEETDQLWPIFEAFGNRVVMPYFDPPVRSIMDRLPVPVLRNDLYERRLLHELAIRDCPGYVPQPRQLGYGLPMGQPGYPDAASLGRAVEIFAKGPIPPDVLRWMLDACSGAKDALLFDRLRRLWTAVVLHAWLETVGDDDPD